MQRGGKAGYSARIEAVIVMNTTEQFISGKICENWDSGQLYLEPNYRDIVEELDLDEFVGKTVFVRYLISDREIGAAELAQIAWAKYALGDVKSEVLYGSEWTGAYGWDSVLQLGGHDLFQGLEGCGIMRNYAELCSSHTRI